MNDNITQMPRWKSSLFLAILLLTVLLVPIVLFEIGLRVAGIQISDDPYLQFGRVNSFFSKIIKGHREYYKVSSREVYRERKIVFSAKKARGTFRIFCLGEFGKCWLAPSVTRNV